MRKRPDIQGAEPENEISLPFTGNSAENSRRVNRETPDEIGIKGKAVNLGVNEEKCVKEGAYYDDEGYDCEGLNIDTGRNSSCKWTGRK